MRHQDLSLMIEVPNETLLSHLMHEYLLCQYSAGLSFTTTAFSRISSLVESDFCLFPTVNAILVNACHGLAQPEQRNEP